MNLTRSWLLLVLLSTGCALFSRQPETRLRFNEQAQAADSANHQREVTIPVSNLKLLVDPHPTLIERDILSAELVATAGGNAVLVKFDPHGAVKLDEMTTRGRGQYLVVFLDDKPVVAWLIDRRLSLGQFLIEADWNDAKAREIVAALTKVAGKYHGGHPLLAPY